MTTNEPKRDPGYRGALPTRNDRLARPWIIAVIAIFVAIFVLSFLEIPSRFMPEPTPLPIPSIPVALPSSESRVAIGCAVGFGVAGSQRIGIAGRQRIGVARSVGDRAEFLEQGERLSS